MAFSRHPPTQAIAIDDFHISFTVTKDTYLSIPDVSGDLNAHDSRPDHSRRDGFGSFLWRRSPPTPGYDPVSGNVLDPLYPEGCPEKIVSRISFIEGFHIDRVRFDSVENVASRDFIQQFREHVRKTFTHWRLQGTPSADSYVLFLGGELQKPMELLTGSPLRLDGLWNKNFSYLVRSAVLGQGCDGEDLESLVPHMIDCRSLGFTDGAHAVNNFTSHDVGDDDLWNMRMYNFPPLLGILADELIRRIKLAFACLFTAVGIPMMLAGEEFADEHDLLDSHGLVNQKNGKQVDTVNFKPASQPDRANLLQHVSKLVKLRTTHSALGLNDANFIHTDFADDKRVLVWTCGNAANPVIVIANFSNWGTRSLLDPGADYVFPVDRLAICIK